MPSFQIGVVGITKLFKDLNVHNNIIYCKSTKFRDRFNFANFAVAYQLNRII